MISSTNQEQGPLSEEHKRQVLDELARVLQSTFFRASKNCCRLLEYSVLHTLQGEQREEMRERIIGVEVFHRPATYDASADPIVRVTANEVRKRLAQYYGSSDTQSYPVISLRPGSYAASFVWKDPTLEPVPAAPTPPLPQSRRPWRKVWLAALAVTLLVPVVAFLVQSTTENTEVELWSPVLTSPKPVLICVAQPISYEPVPATVPNCVAGLVNAPVAGANNTVGPWHFIPLVDAFVGVGDAQAIADISSFLGKRGKAWRLHAGAETPSSELRDGPVVLIGAYENPWTRRMTENLPFVFQSGSIIRDQTHPGKEWRLTQLNPDWHTPEDYAVVSRFLSPETGQPVVVAAGLTNFGTQAAGEFLTNPAFLSQALKAAPKDWRKKGLQFVLHTKVLGEIPGPPEVVAQRFW